MTNKSLILVVRSVGVHRVSPAIKRYWSFSHSMAIKSDDKSVWSSCALNFDYIVNQEHMDRLGQISSPSIERDKHCELATGNGEPKEIGI